MSSEKNKIKYIELTATHFLHELKNVVSDFGAMLILIGAVLIYPIVYSIAYYNETLTEISFGVVDQDHSEFLPCMPRCCVSLKYRLPICSGIS